MTIDRETTSTILRSNTFLYFRYFREPYSLVSRSLSPNSVEANTEVTSKAGIKHKQLSSFKQCLTNLVGMAVLLLITSSSSAPGLSHRRGGLLQTLPLPPWSKYNPLLLKVRTAAHFIPTGYNCLPQFRFVTFLMLLLYLHKYCLLQLTFYLFLSSTSPLQVGIAKHLFSLLFYPTSLLWKAGLQRCIPIATLSISGTSMFRDRLSYEGNCEA